MAIRPLISDMPDCPLLTQSNKQNIQVCLASNNLKKKYNFFVVSGS